MKGFIVYANTLEKDDKTFVQLFGRLENGQSFATINRVNPYFFLESGELKKIKPYLKNIETEETDMKTFAGEKVVKLTSSLQDNLIKIAKFAHEKELKVYESDIKPHTKFIIDNNLLGTIEINGEYEPGERVDRIYLDPKIKPSEFKPELEMISIDLEADKNTDELLCIGIYGKKIKKVFMITDKKLDNTTSCKNEADCLMKFREAVIKIDPDIITGWNITDFDIPYLKKLFEKHQMRFDIGRDNSDTRVRISKEFFRDSTATVAGRQVMDGINLIQDPFIKEAPSIKHLDIESWKLEDVSQAILGETKLIKGTDRHEEIIRLYNSNNEKNLQKLSDYNLQDCRLAYNLLEKTKTIELAIDRTRLTGLTLDRLTASIAAFDSLYIRAAHQKSLVSPSTSYKHKEARIKGGYVMDSKAGIYQNVIVLDFKSLYPSIIKTFNIDPASFITNQDKKDNRTITAPNGAMFRNSEGILPEIITKLHQAREKAKKEKSELGNYAIKIIMNSFFGVLANPNCRYFSLDIANAITHFAQFIIKLTAEKIRERGHEVLYSDTDSVFIDTRLEDSKKAEDIGNELQKYINQFYQEYVKKEYSRTSYLEIEFKRHYLAFMLPAIRDGEKGSKKRYAGLVKEGGKEELEIVGLEAVRGDWTDAAQEFQRELLMHIFHKKEFLAFIRSYVKKIQAGELDSKLVYRKSIRKDLEKYTKTTPPHVKAARQLDTLESNVIEYYITTEGPEPLQKLKHKLDYKHYIEKQIAPIANTILAFFNRTFEDVLKESKQAKLFS